MSTDPDVVEYVRLSNLIVHGRATKQQHEAAQRIEAKLYKKTKSIKKVAELIQEYRATLEEPYVKSCME